MTTQCALSTLSVPQVQQALLAHNWPRGVAYQDDWEGATSFLDCRSASQQPDDPALGAAAAEAGTPQHGDSFSWQVGDADAAVAAGTASQASSCSMGLAAAMRQQLLNLRPGGRSSSFTASGGSTCKPSAGHRRSHSQENGHGPDQQQQQTDLAERIDSTVSGVSSSSSARAARQASATPADSRSVWHHIRGHSPSSSQLAPSPPSFAGSAPPTGTGSAPLSPHSRKSVLGSRPRNLWLFQQLLGPRQEQQKLFSGLRVRMGVVTGTVERGQELKSSALYRSAQGEGGRHYMVVSTFLSMPCLPECCTVRHGICVPFGCGGPRMLLCMKVPHLQMHDDTAPAHLGSESVLSTCGGMLSCVLLLCSCVERGTWRSGAHG